MGKRRGRRRFGEPGIGQRFSFAMREKLPGAEQCLQRGLDVFSARRIVERTGDLRGRFPLVRADAVENLFGQRSRRRFGEPGIGQRFSIAVANSCPEPSNSCNAALMSFPRGESSSEPAISAADFPLVRTDSIENLFGQWSRRPAGNNAYVSFSPFPWTCSVPAATSSFSAFLTTASLPACQVGRLTHPAISAPSARKGFALVQ